MYPKSEEQPYYSNSINSTPDDQQFYEEKPYYLTNHHEEFKNERAEEINIKQSNFYKCRCNKISYFFLCKGIINALTLAITIILVETLELTNKSRQGNLFGMGVIGAIGSLICVIIFTILYFKYLWISLKTGYILLSIFTIFGLCLLDGFVCGL